MNRELYGKKRGTRCLRRSSVFYTSLKKMGRIGERVREDSNTWIDKNYETVVSRSSIHARVMVKY